MKDSSNEAVGSSFEFTVGARLRELRKRRGCSPEELARRAEISIAWYYDLESNDEFYSNCPLSSVLRFFSQRPRERLSL